MKVNNQIYSNKSKTVHSTFELLLISEFELFFENFELFNPKEYNSQKELILNPVSFFPAKMLSPLIDFYRIYMIDPKTDIFGEVIELENVLAVGFSTYAEDFLPGFNFYFQTSEKLYLMSANEPETVYRIVKGISIAKAIFNLLDQHNLFFRFSNSKKLIESLSNFNPASFFENLKEDIVPGEILTPVNFSLVGFKNIFSTVKKYTKILKLHPTLFCHCQSFLVAFLTSFAVKFRQIYASLKPKELFQVFKILTHFNFQLDKFCIRDISFKRFLLSINFSVFEKLHEKIMHAIIGFLHEYFLIPANTPIFFKRNFFGFVFELMLREFTAFEPNVKFGMDLVQKCIEYVNQECFNQIVYNSDLSASQLIHLLNSCVRFNKEFFEFVKQLKAENVDLKFATLLQSQLLQKQVNSLMQVLFNELQIKVEEEVIFFFQLNCNYYSLDLNLLLTQKLFTFATKLEKNLLAFLFETCMNNVLQFILRVYFVTVFVSLSDHLNEVNIHRKLLDDKEVLFKFFEKFVTPANLKMLLDNMDNLANLLVNSNRDQLLTSLIKFDIFFQNELFAETISGLIEKNFNISIQTENEILGYFISKRSEMQLKSQNAVSKSGQSSFSRTVCKKQDKRVYFPILTFSLFKKLKLWVFRARATIFNNHHRESLNLSVDCDLVNNSVNEHFLENNVKVVIFENEEFDVLIFANSLKVN